MGRRHLMHKMSAAYTIGFGHETSLMRSRYLTSGLLVIFMAAYSGHSMADDPPPPPTLTINGHPVGTDVKIPVGDAATPPHMPKVTLKLAPPANTDYCFTQTYSFRVEIKYTDKVTWGSFFPVSSGNIQIESEAVLPSFTIESDKDSVTSENGGWREKDYGVYGGAATVTVGYTYVDKSTNVTLPSVTDYKIENAFYVVGTNPTQNEIIGYIKSLEFVTSGNMITLASIAHNDTNPPTIATQDSTTKKITVTPLTRSKILYAGQELSDEYVTEQVLNVIVPRVAIQESGGGSQFREFEVSDNIKKMYPKWQGNYVGGDLAGLGIFQLTYYKYKNSSTAWNWQKNIIQAIEITATNYRQSCVDLGDDANKRPYSDFSNVFLPGLSSWTGNLNLETMLRLSTFCKYNAGVSDDYYYYNTTGPNPGLETSNANYSIVSGNIAAECSSAGYWPYYVGAKYDLSLSTVVHGVHCPAGIILCDDTGIITIFEKEKPWGSPFDWTVPDVSLKCFQYGGSGNNHIAPKQQFIGVGVYSDASKSTLGARGRIIDGNCLNTSKFPSSGKDAGFMPPAGMWVKFNYIPSTNPGHEENQAWRDYNCDGIADPDGKPYGVGGDSINTDRDLYDSKGNNLKIPSRRSTSYADHAESRSIP